MANLTFAKQQIEKLELENYSFQEVFKWVESIMKPTSKEAYGETMDIAHCVWYQVGRGKTLIVNVPLKHWLRLS